MPGALVLEDGSEAAQLAEHSVRCKVQSLEEFGPQKWAINEPSDIGTNSRSGDRGKV